MVGKVKIGKSFTGICRYVFREDKNALVLDAVGVRTENAADMSLDFEFQRSLRPGLGNAVMHVALALPVEDAKGRSEEEVSELLRRIGQAYVREMKLENTQWALIKHTDKAHPHAHLIVNRVDDNGQTISDKFIGQQSRRVCQGIEQQLQLTVAEQQGRNQAREVGPTHRQATATTLWQKRTADWQRARHEVANALKYTAPSSGSFEELQAKLKTRGVELVLKTHEKENDSAVYGVVFERDGHRIKGSEVAKEYGASKLQQKFAQVQVQRPSLVAQAEQVAKTYSAQALSHLFTKQARQAKEAAEQAEQQLEAARQVRQQPKAAEITPDTSEDRGM